MKILWVLVAVGLVGGEKLDRNYLPPPGAHLAGGVFDDDKLELPKENFQYTNVYESNDREATFNTTPDVRTAGNDGGFSYSFDTSNGIHADESGTADAGVRAEGSYSYIGDDGILYKIEYTADENGFRPRGSHLPTPPPIPKEIQRVIEQAHRNKAAGIFDDGSYDDKKYGFNKYMPRLTNKAQDLLMTNKDLIKNISEKPRKNKNTEYEELRLQASTVDPSPTFEDTNNMQIVDSAQSIFGTSQGYNYESSTPSLTSNTVSHPDNYINTISSTFVTPTTFMPRLYTSKDFADLDQSDRKTIERPKDRVINTSNEHFTTPISTTFSTGIENYNTELPDRSHFEDNAFTQDFSGPKQNQDFDPNTGYYY
ncbi:uncharacterized protein LOC119831949 [Zerene cesonia]|uniref:uncharacterized protein LOC119831949 n=1 Tax=Zerene cesonia TaxID=33412 RepID=UPI0018E4F3B4|nr:uncharacterized protein LOC119831949 [Zerene cesonia]